MEATTRGLEVSSAPFNGHQLTVGFLPFRTGREATHRPGREATHPAGRDTSSRQARAAASWETTRYLAAATQVDTKYAANVVQRIFGEPLRALAPGYGIDVAVVAMWALKALRTRAARDLLLAVVLGFQVLSTTLAITLSPWFLTALPPLFAAAWATVSWEYWERVHHCVIGQLLRDRFNPENAPVPRRARERERLREIAERKDGNLVVFSGSSAFVGTGSTTYNQRILFDISFASEQDRERAERKGRDFTSHDIHLAIVDAFNKAHGLGKSLEDITVRERLFVGGRYVQTDKRLLPDPLRPPCATIDEDLLASAAANPPHNSRSCPSHNSRNYVCVELPGWQGQLVVTLFARAVYTGRSLFVEWTFQVLPPLREAFLRIDSRFEHPRYQQALLSLAAGLGATLPALLCSPATALRPILQSCSSSIRLKRLDYAISHGYVFDYGAKRSIREDASSRTSSNFLLASDEDMYMLLAQQTLLQAVREFLKNHGIDLEKFDKQAQVIFDNSIHIGDIRNSSAIAVGVNSSANSTVRPEGGNEQQNTRS